MQIKRDPMKLSMNQKSRIFIIGNAIETQDIYGCLTSDDVVIRFNNPNPSCDLKADILFVSNGPALVVHRDMIKSTLLKEGGEIIWRYSYTDILRSRYDKVSFSRKVRYLLYFEKFKIINDFNRYPQQFLGEDIQQRCINTLNHKMPSSGFLMIFAMVNLYPEREIYIHNFMFDGWDGHQWELEKQYVDKLISEGLLFYAHQLV